MRTILSITAPRGARKRALMWRSPAWLLAIGMGVSLGPLFAQLDTARISGRIIDPTGAVVPEASIIVRNVDTGIRRQAMSGESGFYSIPMLPGGEYCLDVRREGFRMATRSGIVLHVSQTSRIDVILELGPILSSVTVTTASGIELSSWSANLGTLVSGHQALELPLNVRNVFGLVLLDSSVNNSAQYEMLNADGRPGTADHDISFMNFGGGRFGTTAYQLDGHWNSAGDWNAVIFVPSVDELLEFRIEKNTFSPQHGFSTGNVVNAVTKSGTQGVHGSAYEFHRNDKLGANGFFNNRNGLARPQFSRNQFGFTVGGPLRLPGVYRHRDKTFFFASYEGLRQSTPTTVIGTVPTDLQRQGDFSQTLDTAARLQAIYDPFSTRMLDGKYVRDVFPGNVIPRNRFDPVSKNLLGYWPVANRLGAQFTGQDNFVATTGLPTNMDQYSIRVDHNIDDGRRLFVRWSYKYQMKAERAAYFGRSNPGGGGATRPNDKLDAGLGYTHVFSPTSLMSISAGFGRWVEGLDPQGASFRPSALGLPTVLDDVGGTSGFPGIAVSGITGLGSGSTERSPRDNRSVTIDLSTIRHEHTLTYGFNIIDLQYRNTTASVAGFNFSAKFTQGPDPVYVDPTTGSGFASFLLGVGDGGITLYSQPATDKKLLAWYFNDEWKIRPNLTVNLGLRYDIQTAPTDRFDRLSYFSPEATNPLGQQAGMDLRGGLQFTGDGNPRGIYDVQLTNVAPRLSFVYQPTGKMVVRSGFGIFYTPAIEFGAYQGLPLSGYSQLTSWVGSRDGLTPENPLSNPFPTGLLPLLERSAGLLTNTGQGINSVVRLRPTPYVTQWSFGIQRQLLANTMVEADYVGNHGVKLPSGNIEWNQLPSEYLSLGSELLKDVPNPFYGTAIGAGMLSQSTIGYGQLLRPYPQFTYVSPTQIPSASSWYHALTLSASRRFSGGLQFLISFTASKYLTDNEGQDLWATGANAALNQYDRSLEKSVSTCDIPRSLVISYVYEIPAGRGKYLDLPGRLLNAALDGWQVAGLHTFKSGLPLHFSAPNNSYSFGGGQRPNLVGNPELNAPSVEQWFNAAAFEQPASFTFGNVPRTTPYLRSDGMNNTDLALSKSWRLPEHWRVQFRAEFYNFFNQANFYRPNTSLESPGFGRVTSAYAPRSVQLGLKAYW